MISEVTGRLAKPMRLVVTHLAPTLGRPRFVHSPVDDSLLPFREAAGIRGVGEDVGRRPTHVDGDRSWIHSHGPAEQGGIAVEVERPSFVSWLTPSLTACQRGSVPFEVAVFQFYLGALRRLGEERTSTSLVFSGLVTISTPR